MPTIRIVTLCKRIEKKPLDVVRKEFFYIYRQMYHLATAKICVIDGYNIPVSVLRHKKSLVVIQIWHALGAMKKFGKQTNNTISKRDLAEGFSMHDNYNMILAPSAKMADIFGEAFGYEKKHFIRGYLPRVDYILKQKESLKKRFLEEYPEMKDKKLILYVPTFREKGVKFNYTALFKGIPEGYVLAPRYHEMVHVSGGISDKKKNIKTFPTFSTLQLLVVADYVISDYSAMSFEAIAADKPLYFFVPDAGYYADNPGFNIDPRTEFSSATFSAASDLYNAIKSEKYDWKSYVNFRSKFLGSKKPTMQNTRNLSRIIVKELTQ